MRFINLEIGSQAWLDYRKTGIGASETSIVLGISPHKTRYQMWCDKMSETESKKNWSMQRGNDLEPQARHYAELHFDTILEPKMIEHEFLSWKFATLDGLDVFGDILIEIKWANKEVHEMARKGTVVPYYYAQCQSQLECAGMERMFFMSCYQEKDNEPEYIFVEVKKDLVFIANMLVEERKFYYENMKKNIAPELTDKDYATLPTDEAVNFYNIVCEQYIRLSNEIKALELSKKKCYEAILQACNGKSTATGAFKALKITQKGAVQYDQIQMLKEIDLDVFRKPSIEKWRISAI